MKQKIIAGLGLITALWLPACSSTSDPQDPSPEGRRSQALVAKGDCTFEACSSLPSSLDDAGRVECTSGAGSACEWANGDDNEASVSYRFCQDSECPPRPALDCPGDTVKSSQQCGDENDTGCAWTTVCVPPRETTPCPSKTGCDGQPVIEIGIICSDGTNGGFVCVTDDKSCYWERSCD